MRSLERIVAIAVMFVCLSVHLSIWDGHALWSHGAL